MHDYKQFLNELFSIHIAEVLDLNTVDCIEEHVDDDEMPFGEIIASTFEVVEDDNFEASINKLKENAIIDLLCLNEDQVKKQLIFLETAKNRFSVYWDRLNNPKKFLDKWPIFEDASDLSEDQNFFFVYTVLELESLFYVKRSLNCDNRGLKLKIYKEFFTDLSNLVIKREIILSDFERAVRQRFDMEVPEPKKMERYKLEVFLTDHGLSILPKLKKVYSGAKPEHFAFMIMSLRDLGLIDRNAIANKTLLHDALTNFFGNIGSRQALSDKISLIELGKANYEHKLQSHRSKIKALL